MLTRYNVYISIRVCSIFARVYKMPAVLCQSSPVSVYICTTQSRLYTLYTICTHTYTQTHTEDDTACHFLKTNYFLLIHFYFFTFYFVILLI